MDDMFVHCLLMPSDYGGSLLDQFIDSVGVACPQRTDRKSLAYELSSFRKQSLFIPFVHAAFVLAFQPTSHSAAATTWMQMSSQGDEGVVNSQMRLLGCNCSRAGGAFTCGLG